MDVDRQEYLTRMLDVLNFIGWHDPDEMQGGITAERAFNSACTLLGVSAGKMMNVVRGKPEQEPSHVED